MKRLFSILAISGMMAFGTTVNATTSANTSTAVITVASTTQDDAAPAEEEASFHQDLKKRFIEGGPGFMGIVLLCLILGLAIAIERIIFLNLSTTNTKKLSQEVEDALSSGGVEAAKEVCRNTKGPIASIYYQGLDRTDEGLEAAEKSCCSLRWRSNGTIREKCILDFIIYRIGTNVRFHGYSNWYDSGIR